MFSIPPHTHTRKERGRGNAERNMETFVVGSRARRGVLDNDNRAPSVPQANYTKSSKLTARPVLNSGGHNRLLPPSPLLLLLLLSLLLCWACESKREGAIGDRNERSMRAIECCRCARQVSSSSSALLTLSRSSSLARTLTSAAGVRVRERMLLSSHWRSLNGRDSHNGG